MRFDFFIDVFTLIIDFEMSNNKKIALNIETFAKRFLYQNDELKIAIENCRKQGSRIALGPEP